MKHLHLFSNVGIRNSGLSLHGGRLGHFANSTRNVSSNALSNVKNNLPSVPTDSFNKLSIGSGVKSSVRKAIKPLKYKF